MDVITLILTITVSGGVGFICGVHNTKKMIEKRLWNVLEKHREELDERTKKH